MLVHLPHEYLLLYCLTSEGDKSWPLSSGRSETGGGDRRGNSLSQGRRQWPRARAPRPAGERQGDCSLLSGKAGSVPGRRPAWGLVEGGTVPCKGIVAWASRSGGS